MRVYIGPYKNWIGPYQIAEALFGWPEQDYSSDTPAGWRRRWADRVGAWLADHTPLERFCLWLESKRSRTVRVRLDPYDTWNMDSTLAYIVLPMLKQLQATKHGAPCVDDADVPEHLRSTNAPPKENDWDTDQLFFQRWEWVLGEMIWAFEQKCDPDHTDKFHTGQIEFVHTPVDADGNPTTPDAAKMYRLDRGPNDTHQCDYDGLKAHEDRMQRGFQLFGRYYQALWD